MDSRLRSRFAFRFALALAAMALVTQGCGLFGQATPNRPVGTVGVVASDKVGGGVFVTFDDGRTFRFDVNDETIAGHWPQVGDLLIAGSKPTPWVIGASLEDANSGWPVGCYGLVGNGTETATTVELDVGVTLPKAPNFDPNGRPKDGGPIGGGVICLDREARVINIGVGGV
jgi:hypothetical protein